MEKKIFAHLNIFAVGDFDYSQPVSVIIRSLELYKGEKNQFVKTWALFIFH